MIWFPAFRSHLLSLVCALLGRTVPSPSACNRDSVRRPPRLFAGRLRACTFFSRLAYLAILGAPTVVPAQVASPSATVLSFNAASIGVSAGSAQTLTASFAVSGYAGSFTPIATLHYGFDYSLGAVGCTPSGATETCNITVTFQPTLPGARKDAIFLMNGASRLATVLLGGVGQGPLSLVQPGTFTTSVPTTNYIYQSVADENGVVYILPSGNNPYIERVTKAGVASQISLNNPPYFWTIGIDGAGVLYLFNETSTVTTYDTVQGVQGTYQIPSEPLGVNPTDDWYPGALGVDGSIYVVNQIRNNGVAYALKPDGTTAYADTFSPGVLQPFTAAVDSAGDFFVGGYEINKITPAGVQTQVNTVGASEGLAVDAADTLYATRYNPTGGVAQLPASDYSTPIASFGRSSPLGMSLGSDGTLYVSNYVNLDIFDRSQTETVDFGEVTAGSSETNSTASVYNGGNQALTISGFTLSGAGFSLDPNATNECAQGTVLAPGALCQASVVFTPGHPGSFSGTISITSNSLNGANTGQTIELVGTSYGSYDVLSPNPLAFASQAVGTSQSLPVTLTNEGNYYASSIYSTSTDNPAFTIARGTCSGVTIPVGSNCQLQVTFSPTGVQAYTGNATVVTYVSGTGQPFQTITLPLSGTGTTTASLSSTSLAFGSEPVGVTSASQSVTLTNTGSAALIISSIGLTGANASSFLFNNNCGAGLAAGASCTIHGHFTPVATGALTAAVTIADNASGSPQSIALSGTGGVALASLSATSLSFGSEKVGTTSASQSVTLTNTGGIKLVIASIGVTGANASSFVFGNNCGTGLAAGASCTIHGHFTPATTGALTAAVIITDNASGSPQSITLSGTGAIPAAVSLSTNSLTFPSQAVGTTSASQQVTLTNTGGSALVITSVTVTGTNASSFVFASSCGSSVAAGASCTIHGHFTPTAAGALTAAVTIIDNATDSPQSITLTGTGH